MSPAEVVAVEIKQYLDPSPGLTSLLPRIAGNTVAVKRKKAARPQGRTWDAGSVFDRIREHLGKDECAAARSIYEWGLKAVPEMRWGKRTVDGSFTLVEPTPSGACRFLAVYTSGHVELRFGAS